MMPLPCVDECCLRLLIEHVPAAVAMLDREMRYLVVSRRYLSNYGLPEENIIGRSHYDVFPEIPERWGGSIVAAWRGRRSGVRRILPPARWARRLDTMEDPAVAPGERGDRGHHPAQRGDHRNGGWRRMPSPGASDGFGRWSRSRPTWSYGARRRHAGHVLEPQYRESARVDSERRDGEIAAGPRPPRERDAVRIAFRALLAMPDAGTQRVVRRVMHKDGSSRVVENPRAEPAG